MPIPLGGIFAGVGFALNAAANTYNAYKGRQLQKQEGEENRATQKDIAKQISEDQEAQRELQEKLSELQIRAQLLIDKNNRNLQRELHQERQQLQKELAIFAASMARKNMLDNNIQREELSTWPLHTLPHEIMNSYDNHAFRPLRVIVIPPDPRKELQGGEKLRGIFEFVLQEIGDFLNKHYSEQGHLIEFLGDNWRARYTGEAAARKIFNQLQGEPFLIVQMEMIRHMFTLKMIYWNVGAVSYQSNIVIKQMPLEGIIADLANQTNGSSIPNKKTFDQLIKVIAVSSLISTVLVIENHLLANHITNRSVLLPQLSGLLGQLKGDSLQALRQNLLSWAVGNYGEMIQFLSPNKETALMRHPDIEVDPFFFDRPETVLQLQLGLATNLYRNGHYEQGRPFLQDCLQSWGEIKGLRPGELEHLTTDELHTLYQVEDDDFFNALVPILLNSEAQQIPDQLSRLLKGWSDLKRQ